ncbi:MAG: HNH endonuclease [Desulfobacterales bacterium]|nr:HNH endonuclease [Desulfobacterales bacterium]
MSMDYFGFDGVDDATLRRERAKARELRKSRWWKRKLAQGVCYYCGRKEKGSGLTMDHLVPLARGGRSTRDNIVCACKRCNTRKRSLLPMEWEEQVARDRKMGFTK